MSFPPDTPVPCTVRVAANFNERPAGAAIDTLVLHYTGMESEEAALDWLCVAKSRVSCHYFIFGDGRIVQTVPEALRAWHAGVSAWRGRDDLNSRSIGIEIANPGHQFGYRPFPPAQIDAAIALAGDIVKRRAIEPRNVVAHSDIAPARKQDPGELFPWDRLFAAGIGAYVAPAPQRRGAVHSPGDAGRGVARFQRRLALYGYPVNATGRYDEQTSAAVVAFQRHFRPACVDGRADAQTRGTLERLLKAI